VNVNPNELLAKAQHGDMEAFAELFEPLRPSVYAVAVRLTGENDAEDIVMQTFLKAWQALPRFDRRASLKTWLYRIARNCSIDHLRARHTQRAHTLSVEELGSDGQTFDLPDTIQAQADTETERHDLAAILSTGLAQLGEEHRTALLLRYVDGMAYAEIAAATGVGIGTVMSRLFYAKRKLKTIVEDHL